MAKADTEPSNESSPASSNGSDGPQTPNVTSSYSTKKGKTTRTPLSETQKNTNHKDAENKRRNAIREQFTQLSSLVPDTEGHAKSELFMLEKTIEYFRQQVNENRDIVAEIEKHGVHVEDNLRPQDHHHGGSHFRQNNLEEFEKARAKRMSTSGQNGAKEGNKDEE